MKLQQLLETPNTPNEDELKSWDWIAMEILFGHKYALESFKTSGIVSPYEFCKSNQSIQVGYGDYFSNILVVGNRVSSFGNFCIYNLDEAGPPPFELATVETTFEIKSHAESLTEIPKWFPKTCKELIVAGANIGNLSNLGKVVKICGEIRIHNAENKVPTNWLSVCKIKGLRSFKVLGTDESIQASNLLTDYIAAGADILDCQSELIDAGLEEYAKL